ncbi:acyltransferase family protein [Catenisphaera adipataccumulans]|uniref:Serine/alanine racemase n=1 Tax=Catenisphaera adipataccumulans TaxID=700500 RepID=A0A7W8FVS6_9FIRM|nr:serine/alanine racemase [Catenisphaera adipataccumulans]
MARKKYGAIDIAKYISALLVVCIHTYPFYEVSPTFNMYWIQTLCRMAVPFFFVTSGFFFFRKWEKDNEEANWTNLKKYESRLLKLYLIWTVIYLPYTIWDYTRAQFKWYHIFAYLRDLILNGSYYHLWFFPALMLGMAIVYGLYRRYGMKHTLFISLILYLIGYMINVYTPLWESGRWPYVTFFFGFFTKVFTTSRNGIFFGPMFISIGLLLSRTRRLPHRVSVIGWAISFVLLIIEVSLYDRAGLLRDLTSMDLMLVPCVYFLVNALLTDDRPYKARYLNMRHESLLIYTSHILFAKILLAVMPHAHLVVYFLTLGLAQCFATAVLTLKDRYPVLENLL